MGTGGGGRRPASCRALRRLGLAGCGVAVDKHGFVQTGPDASAGFPARPATALETSVPGVFAVGDVRSGSVKRVGGAIGEGAAENALEGLERHGTDTA